MPVCTTLTVGKAAGKDSIGYIEYWVGGKKVDTVKKGDQLEVRVVFTVASSGGTIRLAIQRIPGGAYVSSPDFTRIPGTYYYAWGWHVEYTGDYTIKVDLFNNGNLVDTKSFPHTVSA
jgi:hypothetical protein